MSDWVKKLGQWHIYDPKAGRCLCGQRCLGNNYADSIPKEERRECPDCFRILKERSA